MSMNSWSVGRLSFSTSLSQNPLAKPAIFQFLKYISVEGSWQLVLFLFFFFGGGQTCELHCWSLRNFLLSSVNMLMATMSNSLTPALLPI